MNAPIGPYTPLVRAGEWLIASGQLGVKDGALVPGGTAAQCRQALENLRQLLEAEGAGLHHVVKATVLLRHMSDFDVMNEAYAAAFGDHRPARTAYAVAELPRGALVEIEAWAHLGG